MNSTNKAVSDKIDILNKYYFFANASKDLQSDIHNQSIMIYRNPGALFYQKTDHRKHILLIGSGSLRVYVVGDTGREITLYHVCAGETCPINALAALQNLNTPATAVVESGLSAVLLPTHCFQRWLSEQELVRKFVLETFATRLVEILYLMEDISFRKLDQRLAVFLSNRFKQSEAVPPGTNLTHEKIAVELGSAREVISRLLRKFEREGLVELSRGRIIRKYPFKNPNISPNQT